MTPQEQLTIVCRAIHTLDKLAENGTVQEGTLVGGFVSESWSELHRLRDALTEQHADLRPVDLGEFIR